MKIKVASKEFQDTLVAISNVFRGGATLKVHKEYIEAIAASVDNSISICCKVRILNEEDINLSNNEEFPLYVADLTKFIKLLTMNESETFEFEVKNNYVYFKSDKIHGAKFVLDDIPPQKLPVSATSKKFNSLVPKYEVELTKNQVKEIMQAASFADASDKIYFYQKDNALIAEFNDRTLDNISNISLKVSEEGTGTIEDKVIIAVDAFNSIITTSPTLKFGVIGIAAKNVKFEALLITISNNDSYIKYLFNSKVR